MHAIREADIISDRDFWIEALRAIRKYSLQPQIPPRIYPFAKRNVPSPENLTTGSKIQARSPKGKSHDRASHLVPGTTGNDGQSHCRGIIPENSGNTRRNVAHSQVPLATPAPLTTIRID